jgi:hypothetical protein
MLVERPVGAKRGRSPSRPLAAEPAHRRLRRDHAELERRLAVAVRALGTLTEGMGSDGIAEDRSESALTCRIERVIGEPPEDSEAAISGVNNCGAGLGGRDARNRHRRPTKPDPHARRRSSATYRQVFRLRGPA